MKGNVIDMKKQSKQQSLKAKLPSIVLWLLRVSFVIAIIGTLLQGNNESAIISAVGLLLSFLPNLIENRLKIDLPISYELVIVAFVFLTVLMGEVGDAYEKLWWWDVVLHSSSGVLLGFAGFLTLFVLYRQGRLKLSAAMIAFFTFALGVASAGLWEIFEFTADSLFGTAMQKGATDTMSDIIVATIGAGIAAFMAYRHITEPKKSGIGTIMKDFTRSNPKSVRKQLK